MLTTKKAVSRKKYGRGDGIRTHGLYVPNVALYQTEPHLDMCEKISAQRIISQKNIFVKTFFILAWRFLRFRFQNALIQAGR